MDDAIVFRYQGYARKNLAPTFDSPQLAIHESTTIAGAAVYAADRVTDGKAVTQQQVADAASVVVPTSRSKIDDYSRRLYNTADAGMQPDDAMAGLIRAD